MHKDSNLYSRVLYRPEQHPAPSSLLRQRKRASRHTTGGGVLVVVRYKFNTFTQTTQRIVVGVMKMGDSNPHPWHSVPVCYHYTTQAPWFHHYTHVCMSMQLPCLRGQCRVLQYGCFEYEFVTHSIHQYSSPPSRDPHVTGVFVHSYHIVTMVLVVWSPSRAAL